MFIKIKLTLKIVVVLHRSLDGAHGQLLSICQRGQDRTLRGASAVQKRWSQHGGQVFMGFSTQYAQSHLFWCRPNKNISYFSEAGWGRGGVPDQMSFDGSLMFSCHVVALSTTVLHTVSVYLCVLFGMSCCGMYMYRRVSDRQTDKQTVCEAWARGL